MAEETTQQENTTVASAPRAEDAAQGAAPRRRAPRGRGAAAGSGRPGGRGRGNRSERPRSEFMQKIIGIRRVTRVMAGGRRFSFSVAIVLGDKNGRVGVGTGKASDTALAIEKAARSAKKHMVTLALTPSKSIPHNVEAKYCASEVEIRPAAGRGLVAGSSVRTVLELAGVTDVTAKLLSRSKNPINNARAAMEALQSIKKKS